MFVRDSDATWENPMTKRIVPSRVVISGQSQMYFVERRSTVDRISRSREALVGTS